MRFDLRAPGATAVERGERYRTALDMAAWGEHHGCAVVGVSEHHCSPDGFLPSPLVVAAGLAAVTTTVPIIVAAAILPFYDPVRLAEDLIVLDHLGQGRVVVILGLGYRTEEYALHGLEFSERGRIADEKLEVLLQTLRDAGSDTSTPCATPPPFTDPMPMLAWGGGSKAAARRAGRHGLAFVAQGPGPELAKAYEAAARASGHEPGFCSIPDPDEPQIVFVDDDPDRAWAEVGPAMLVDALAYREWNPDEATVGLSSARSVDELKTAKGPHRVVTSVEAAALAQRHGVVGLHPMCGGLAPDTAWRYLQQAADALAP